MAKDRLAPCEYYICKGECSKHITDGADMSGKCKVCRKYKPRKGFKTVDKVREGRLKESRKQIKDF